MAISSHLARNLRPHLYSRHGDGGLLSLQKISETNGGIQNPAPDSVPDDIQIPSGGEFYLYGHKQIGGIFVALPNGEVAEECCLLNLPDDCTLFLCIVDLSKKRVDIHRKCRSTTPCECLEDAGPRALARWIHVSGMSADQNVPWLRRRVKVTEVVQPSCVPVEISALIDRQISAAHAHGKEAHSNPGALGALFRLTVNHSEPMTEPYHYSYEAAQEYWQSERPRRSKVRTVFYGISPPTTPIFSRPKRKRQSSPKGPISSSPVKSCGSDSTETSKSALQHSAPEKPLMQPMQRNSNCKSQSKPCNSGKKQRLKKDPLVGLRICKLFSSGTFEGPSHRRCFTTKRTFSYSLIGKSGLRCHRSLIIALCFITLAFGTQQTSANGHC